MIAYASRTGTRSTIKAMRAAGWRMLLEPSQYGFGLTADPPPLPYMLDNGAWGCFRRGVEWDEEGFLRLMAEHGDGADAVVLPDIVGGGYESLELSSSWAPRVAHPRRLLAVQDGMVPDDVADVCQEHGLGIFVGGSTEWKLNTLPWWGWVSRQLGCWLHVARVNSARRIVLCQDAGAHSFDGTSVTRFPCTLPLLDNARRQGSLW